MDTTQWMVTAIGLVLIAGIAIYFFIRPKESVSVASTANGIQEQNITVKGGYHPSEIRLRRGIPARLIFLRDETTSCSEEVLIPEFGVRRALPAFAKTVIEFTPDKAGTFEFMCGMNMLHGSLIIE